MFERGLGLQFVYDVFLGTDALFFMMTSSNGNISALLSLCAGNSPVTGEFASQRPVTRSCDAFFDLRLNINGWVNNREAGDLRRHCAHYEVTVIFHFQNAVLSYTHIGHNCFRLNCTHAFKKGFSHQVHVVCQVHVLSKCDPYPCLLSATVHYYVDSNGHKMETILALLPLCAGNSPVTGEFLSQRPVARSFDACFDLRLNKRLSKQ